MANLFRRTFAKLAVGSLLLTAGIVARVGRAVRGGTLASGNGRAARGRNKRGLKILVVGTFYNPNWIRSHLFPLAKAENVSEVAVVSSARGLEYPRVVYDVPPVWMGRVFGRAAAKALWFFVAAWRRKPDFAVGYHIMPNGLLTLMASGLFGCRSVYQMTGGPLQFAGGGYQSENPLLHMQGTPSRVLEGWMFGVGRLLDVIVVRGQSAAKVLA